MKNTQTASVPAAPATLASQVNASTKTSFRERFERFAVGYMSGADWSDELEWLCEGGLPPVGHFHNDSERSCGLGREEWLSIASGYFEMVRLRAGPQTGSA